MGAGARAAAATAAAKRGAANAPPPMFKKLLAANRGEIAIRILRAATELGVPSVSMFSYEDRYSPHRCVRQCQSHSD
jgi:pyruvate carboxylase